MQQTILTPNDIAILAYWFSRTQLHANYRAHVADAGIMSIWAGRRAHGWTPAQSADYDMRQAEHYPQRLRYIPA